MDDRRQECLADPARERVNERDESTKMVGVVVRADEKVDLRDARVNPGKKHEQRGVIVWTGRGNLSRIRASTEQERSAPR
jgi:hypothetical protein